MAKKRTIRERPTLKTLRELRDRIDHLSGENAAMTERLASLSALAENENSRGIVSGENLEEAKGLLHNIIDELGPSYASVLTNRIRRFLGRGGEAALKSRTQVLLEKA